MKLAVVGMSIAGLVTGAGFAELGHEVECYDDDSLLIERLASGAVDSKEPGLQALIARNAKAERLKFRGWQELPESAAEVIFLTEGTPSGEDGNPQLGRLWTFVDRLPAGQKRCRRIVVIRSSVPVGTADRLENRLRRRLPELGEVAVASVPDFAREGSAVRDFFEPSQIVIGASDEATEQQLRSLHSRLAAPILTMDRRSAELGKMAVNGFLAVKLAYANEMAALSEQTGADYAAVERMLGLDPRIGSYYLGAGLGFGGPHLPKDARALVRTAEGAGAPQTLLAAAMRANAALPLRMVRKLEAALSGPSRRRIALLGLAYKAGSAEMSEAPSVRLAAELLRRHPGIQLAAYDPAAGEAARQALPGAVQLCDSAEEALCGSDAAILVTDWPEFRCLTAEQFKRWMKRPIVLDGRNALNADLLNAQGVVCIGAGRLPDSRGAFAGMSTAADALPRATNEPTG
ncbi:UDP-glucose dehydrogenase family protein [Cohnella fermenti]|nr:nucleotide sugar dehydrogenase [Cohnella fermenti]